jgi:glycosyltransferase involved in cell wall biosynthesis
VALVRRLDLILALFVLGLGLVWLVPLAMVCRLRRWLTPPRRGRRILYLGTGRIAQVFPRNGVNLFLERECSDFDGYFEQLWNVHFPAGNRGTLDLTPRHHLIDVDRELPDWSKTLRATATAVREVTFLVWLLPFVMRQRISVVTATNPYLQGLNAGLVGALLGLPFGVIITRDFDWDWTELRKQAFPSAFPSRAIEKRVERWVLARAALVLADRCYYRDFAVRNGAAPTRAVATRVLADGAYASARFDPSVRIRHGLTDGPLLTYVGRLDADKFPGDLVECLARVRQRFPRAQLACCGTGALERELRALAGRLGVGEATHLLGSLPLDELAALVASSDVVVAAHMGYTLVEAGLTGVPIATYDFDYHGEILEDGVSGMLAPFRDVDALAERVCVLLADPPRARRMGALARQRLLTEHSRAAVIPLYRAAYARVLGGRERAAGSRVR